MVRRWDHDVDPPKSLFQHPASIRYWADARFVAIATVVSLGLAIGVTATILAIGNDLYVRSLNIGEYKSTVLLERQFPGSHPSGLFAHADFEELKGHTLLFSDVAAFNHFDVTFRSFSEAPTQAGLAAIVSWNYFQILGVSTVLGRGFSPPDEVPGGTPVAIISYRLWQSVFGGEADVLERVADINDAPFTIVGVAPPGFSGPFIGDSVDFWITTAVQPLVLTPPQPVVRAIGSRSVLHRSGFSWLYVLARLRAGVTPEHVQSRLQSPTRSGPNVARYYAAPLNERRLPVQLQRSVFETFRLFTILACVALVVACTNVALLLLQGGLRRMGECAVRLALGATRTRLFLEHASRATALTVGGLLLGLLVYGLSVAWVRDHTPLLTRPIRLEGRLGLAGLLLSALLAGLLALAAAVVPFLALSRQRHLSQWLRASHVGSTRVSWLTVLSGPSLLAFESALCTAAVVFALGLGKAMYDRLTTDPGFKADVLVMQIDLRRRDLNQEAGLQYYRQLLQHIRSRTVVEDASLARSVPGTLASSTSVLNYDPRPATATVIGYNVIDPAFFSVLRIPVYMGTTFEDSVGGKGSRSVILPRALANRAGPEPVALGAVYGGRTVVGIVGDTRRTLMSDEPQLVEYLPLGDAYEPRMTLIVRCRVSPSICTAPLRTALQEFDPRLPTAQLLVLEQHLRSHLKQQVFTTGLLIVLSILTLVLAWIGSATLSVSAIASRRRELAIRQALGAPWSSILRAVLGTSAVATGAGVVLGCFLAQGSHTILQHLIGKVTPGDWPILFGAAFLTWACTVGASLLPTRRYLLQALAPQLRPDER